MRKTRLAPLSLSLIALAACSGKGRAALPAAAPSTALGVRAVKPQQGTTALTRVTGELRARREAVISPEVSGRIDRLRVDVGDRVRQGEVLVELASSSARIAVEQARAAKAMAEAALKGAQSDAKRTQELARGDAASPAALERAETGLAQATAAVAQATAALAAAEDQLAKHTIRAPFDGIVTARMKSPGEFVAMMPPTPVLSLVDVASIEVRAAVPESVVDLIRPGAELGCTVSPSGKAFRAKLRTVGAVVEPGSRTVDVRLDLASAAFRELRPGAIVEVALGANGAGEGLFLPSETVQQAGADVFVWTVKGETVQKRPVRVERLTPGLVRVVSGVGTEDLVVAEAGAGLADGTKVRVLQ